MDTDNRDVSFNLVEDLNILFVDIDNRDGKRQYRAVDKFFQADTILWDFIHDYLPLKNKPKKIDVLNIYDVLRANEMGYTHIVVDGKKWEQFSETEQSRLINNFKENVRKLMPQLLVVLGRKTYEELFKGTQPRIKGVMPTGFRPHTIKWQKSAKDRIRGSTKIFLMRKTRFKNTQEKSRCGRLLASSFKHLRAFKEKHGDLGESHKRKRSLSDENGTTLSVEMNQHLQAHLQHDTATSSRSTKMSKSNKKVEEEDELSDDTNNDASSGSDAD
ncbi:hypothetical protein K501DRAFT_339166 [Backusella circina FSU 941]|nr:hypothetical protein K501DRAFT_339166 [Backusella circina FSU 941]